MRVSRACGCHRSSAAAILVPDPFVTLAAAAAATEGVELGTATVQVPLHHPADLAHRVLSLQLVCGDRLTLGVSPGSTATDYDTFDRDYAARFRTFDENVARLRVLLADGRDERADLAPARGSPAAAAAARLLGCERRAGRPGVRRLARLRLPPDAGPDHRRPRTVPGRRWPTGDRLRHPAVRRDDLGPTGEMLQRYAEAGFDDAVVLIEPGGPDPELVRALLP